MPKPKTTPEKEQNIINAYKTGMDIEKIEKQYETGRSSIYRILKRNNIPRSGNHSKHALLPQSEETKQKISDAKTQFWQNKKGESEEEYEKRNQQIIQAYKDNITISQIEKDFNTSANSIYRLLENNNIPHRRDK